APMGPCRHSCGGKAEMGGYDTPESCHRRARRLPWRTLRRSSPMSTKIAINGFGRIGRCIVRALVDRGVTDLELVAINDLTDAKTLAHLYNYDSVHRRAKHPSKALEGAIDFGAFKAKVIAERDPVKLPWKELGVDIVLESTGLFTDKEKASAHLQAGAK